MTSAFLTLTKGRSHTTRSNVKVVEVSAFSECFLFNDIYTSTKKSRAVCILLLGPIGIGGSENLFVCQLVCLFACLFTWLVGCLSVGMSGFANRIQYLPFFFTFPKSLLRLTVAISLPPLFLTYSLSFSLTLSLSLSYSVR